MAPRFFLSLTAFSLAFSLSISADQFSVSNVQESEEYAEESNDQVAESGQEKDDASSSRRLAFPTKKKSVEKVSVKQETAEVLPEQKKLKPHYAGVRKPQAKPVSKKKSSKIKNQWFSSKTHPKVEKKEVVQEEQPEAMTAELPADSPFYIRKTNWTSQNTSRPAMKHSQSTYDDSDQQLDEGELYPKGGFQAPQGHVYLTAEYLLWRTRQEGMEFATAKKVNFEFDSGFRVGLGVHMPYDGWDVYANYTRFIPEQSRSAHGSFYPLFLFEGAGAPQGPVVAEAHAHWKIEYQAVDLQVGRSYYIAQTLILRPFLGLKGAWIDQHARFHYEGGFIPAGQNFRTHFDNDFKGAGPLIGIDSNWQMGAGFSLFGDFAAALVVGHFDNEQEQHQLNDAEVVHLDSDFNLVSPFFQMVAGIAWDRNFNKDRCHVGLSAGFETQYWWSQNQTEQFTDKDFPIYIREKGDLSFYGLTLRGRFDF